MDPAGFFDQVNEPSAGALNIMKKVEALNL